MSTTLSMWLGITFLLLAITAVLLQAWLWGPQFWDEEAKKTRAPKFWLRMHALAGYSYGLIYLFMMWHMLPRLWEYQYELPARTVIHAVLAIAIGVLLVTKIMILLFFRHFEEAMPRYGFGLLICTVAMTVLSVPYALRAHDLSGRTTDPDNVERVRTLLAELDMGEGAPGLDVLTTEAGFDHGRQVLVGKCITCHDMRTVLAKPRTAKGWFDINERMLDKPAVFGDQLAAEDIPFVTAYLVAITPDIQESAKRKREDRREVLARTDAMIDAVHDAQAATTPVDMAAGEAALQAKCIECHELDEVVEHGGDDVAGWRSVVAAMVEEGAEISEEESVLISRYLAAKWPRVETGSSATATSPTEDEGTEGEDDGADDKDEGTESEDDGAEATPTDDAATTEGEDGGTPTEAEPKAEPKPKAEPEAQPKPKPKPKKPAKPKADKKAGRELYMAKCKTCHGDDGKGDTPFGRKLEIVSLAGSGRSKSKIRSIIAKGVPGTKMKPYEGKISEQDLDNVAAFVKSL